MTAKGSLRTDEISAAAACSVDRVGQQTIERLRRLVLAHVEPDQPVRRSEEELGERLRDLGLPRARRADEEEDAERPRRIGHSRLDHRDALDDAVDGLGLLEDALREERLHGVQRERRGCVEERERKTRSSRPASSSTSLPSNVAAPCSAASAAVAWTSRRRFPGCATLGRNCCASSSASARVSSSASTPSASCSSACLATATRVGIVERAGHVRARTRS